MLRLGPLAFGLRSQGAQVTGGEARGPSYGRPSAPIKPFVGHWALALSGQGKAWPAFSLSTQPLLLTQPHASPFPALATRFSQTLRCGPKYVCGYRNACSRSDPICPQLFTAARFHKTPEETPPARCHLCHLPTHLCKAHCSGLLLTRRVFAPSNAVAMCAYSHNTTSRSPGHHSRLF